VFFDHRKLNTTFYARKLRDTFKQSIIITYFIVLMVTLSENTLKVQILAGRNFAELIFAVYIL